jgi:hypothetical protein
MTGRSTGAILDGIIARVPVPESPAQQSASESQASKHRA